MLVGLIRVKKINLYIFCLLQFNFCKQSFTVTSRGGGGGRRLGQNNRKQKEKKKRKFENSAAAKKILRFLLRKDELDVVSCSCVQNFLQRGSTRLAK